VTINRWLSGEQAIPPDFALPKEPEPELPIEAPLEPVAQAEPEIVEAPASELTPKEREALPIGSPGWRYDRASTLPKGRHIERYDAPDIAPNGAVVLGIVWCSNGVGRPSMVLFGDITDMRQMPDKPSFSPLAPGVYRPALNLDKEKTEPRPKGGPKAA
jgi:hypothetical protein